MQFNISSVKFSASLFPCAVLVWTSSSPQRVVHRCPVTPVILSWSVADVWTREPVISSSGCKTNLKLKYQIASDVCVFYWCATSLHLKPLAFDSKFWDWLGAFLSPSTSYALQTMSPWRRISFIKTQAVKFICLLELCWSKNIFQQRWTNMYFLHPLRLHLKWIHILLLLYILMELMRQYINFKLRLTYQPPLTGRKLHGDKKNSYLICGNFNFHSRNGNLLRTWGWTVVSVFSVVSWLTWKYSIQYFTVLYIVTDIQTTSFICVYIYHFLCVYNLPD